MDKKSTIKRSQSEQNANDRMQEGSSGTCDLILHNANVITMNPDQPRADAVAIRGGRIIAVGSWEDVALQAENMRTLDLEGKTVLPGFIDSHVHFTLTGLKEVALDFSSAETVDDVQAILAQAAARASSGQLIFGMNFRSSHVSELPTSTDLDDFVPDHPVFILGDTAHYSLANTRCLQELNLPKETPGLEATGILRDRANSIALQEMYTRFILEHGIEKLQRSAAQLAVSVGLTTVHALEGSDQPDDTTVQTLLSIAPELQVRLVVWYQTRDVTAVKRLGLPRIGGCILLDGDLGPHTAALSEPYADQPGNRGTLYLTQDEVNTFVEEAHNAGLQIALHGVGDRAAEQALNAYERALTLWPRKDHRHRIEHFEIYNEKLTKRARRLGAYLAIQPPFNGYYGGHTSSTKILGKKRTLRLDPVASLIKDGVHVGGGSDSTVTPLNPLYGVQCAVNHSNPTERLDVERALQLYTLDNAAIAFEERDKGSIEVGKLGDLVVLDDDPHAVAPDAIADISVEMTIVGGEIVYSR